MNDEVAGTREAETLPLDKKSRYRMPTIITLALIAALMILALTESAEFSSGARLLPLVVGIPTLLLTIYALLKELVRPQRSTERTSTSDIRVIAEDPRVAARPLKVMAVILIFAVLILTLGFFVGGGIFVFGFIWLYGKEHILKALFITAVVLTAIYLIFVRLLGLRVFSGFFL